MKKTTLMLKKHFALAACLVLAGPVLQMHAQESGASVVVELTKKADQGDAEAQFKLGAEYLTGVGRAQNYENAAIWFQKAANQGKAEAQLILAQLYLRGNGVVQSNEKAAMWFQKAADQGNADAQGLLGVLYIQGKGVPQSEAQGIALLTKSASQGNAHAQEMLNKIHAEKSLKRLSQSESAAVCNHVKESFLILKSEGIDGLMKHCIDLHSQLDHAKEFDNDLLEKLMSYMYFGFIVDQSVYNARKEKEPDWRRSDYFSKEYSDHVEQILGSQVIKYGADKLDILKVIAIRNKVVECITSQSQY